MGSFLNSDDLRRIATSPGPKLNLGIRRIRTPVAKMQTKCLVNLAKWRKARSRFFFTLYSFENYQLQVKPTDGVGCTFHPIFSLTLCKVLTPCRQKKNWKGRFCNGPCCSDFFRFFSEMKNGIQQLTIWALTYLVSLALFFSKLDGSCWNIAQLLEDTYYM